MICKKLNLNKNDSVLEIEQDGGVFQFMRPKTMDVILQQQYQISSINLSK